MDLLPGDIAIELANGVRGARGRIGSSGALEWQALDYRGRKAPATASLDLSQDQLYQYVQEEFRGTAETMIAQGVPLIPAPRDVVPISIVREPVDASCPPTDEVMWDILFDSLGLLDEREFFFEAANAIDGTTDYTTRMSNSMGEDQRQQAIDALFDLLEFLLHGGTIAVLARMAGDRLGKRFLRKLTIPLIPLVGTGYATAALGLAIHRHWDRLVCAR